MILAAGFSLLPSLTNGMEALCVIIPGTLGPPGGLTALTRCLGYFP
jgi:hypothetical protein